MIDIKKWTGTLLSLVAACLPGLASSAAIPITNLVQIVASDAATAKTVAWQDDSGRSDYTVVYRQQGNTDTPRAFCVRCRLGAALYVWCLYAGS